LSHLAHHTRELSCHRSAYQPIVFYYLDFLFTFYSFVSSPRCTGRKHFPLFFSILVMIELFGRQSKQSKILLGIGILAGSFMLSVFTIWKMNTSRS